MDNGFSLQIKRKVRHEYFFTKMFLFKQVYHFCVFRILEGFVLSLYAWNKCFQNIEYLFLVVFFSTAFFIIIFYFLSSFKKYIVITPSGISHKQNYFLWSEIQNVSLVYPKFPTRERNLIPRLELKLFSGTHKIGLKMLTDTERRNLLDCIEKYKTIVYNRTKYESNYIFWTMTTMIFLFIFGNIMLLIQ